jgi:hypothetical protein
VRAPPQLAWLAKQLSVRDRERLDVHGQVVAVVNVSVGVNIGAFWEFLEFVLDWVRYSDLQKSTDTMTDMLWNNLAAVLGTLEARSRRSPSPGSPPRGGRTLHK